MTLTESKDSVTYSIKNKCIHKIHDIKYSFLILVSNIVDEHVDCFDLATVHFKDNVENVLLIERLLKSCLETNQSAYVTRMFDL